MADPMWTGGADQFQDMYPWVWATMSTFNRAPFLPTDPPRTPEAFYSSVAPMCDYPVLGIAWAWAIPQYAVYYAQEWAANPPATSTTTPNTPTLDDDTSISAKIDLLSSLVLSLHAKVGAPVEDDTLASLSYFTIQQITGIPGPITGYATSIDTARILAALYYIAQSVIVPAWAADNTEVMSGLQAMTTSFSEQHGLLDDHLDNQDAALTSAAAGINTNVDNAETAIIADTGATEDAIILALGNIDIDTSGIESSLSTALADLNEIQATLAALVIPTSGGLRWPGLSSVTLSTPVVLSAPTTITALCHGCIVDVLAVPSGQSVQHADTATRYKGIAWLAFESDRGDWEALQQINLGRQVLLSKELEEASKIAVYCKPGGQLRVTPFVLTPA